MEQTITPIVRGALFRDVSGDETHGNLIRIKNIWIDVDGSIQVSFYPKERDHISNPTHKTVDKESFMDRLTNDEIIRVNSDHEAWEYRHD